MRGIAVKPQFAEKTEEKVKQNILMIVSDEERRNDWLKGKISMPAHERLERDGLSFNRYYTHSSPCSPSRASLYNRSLSSRPRRGGQCELPDSRGS